MGLTTLSQFFSARISIMVGGNFKNYLLLIALEPLEHGIT